VRVDRGHLEVEDGICANRRKARFPRVGHGLRRLVVVGNDGMISLAGLRWLADQGAALALLDRQGKVLMTTGPAHSSDARLRRAQALAHQSGAALQIARSLMQQKLAQQERIIRERFRDPLLADLIGQARSSQANARSIDEVRHFEALAAKLYWSSWRGLSINYPKNDLPRVPEHWRKFGTRHSPLTGSPRRAINPPNAMLNFLYSLVACEARLALAAVGLDPGLGMLHADTPNRDSLACDLVETARPLVDIYVHDWISHQLLRREWFFEDRDGNCRLMGPFVRKLSETSEMWQRLIAPHAEWIARTLWKRRTQASKSKLLSTPLTQDHRRIAQGADRTRSILSGPKPLASRFLRESCLGEFVSLLPHRARSLKLVREENERERARYEEDRREAEEERLREEEYQRKADVVGELLTNWKKSKAFRDLAAAIRERTNTSIASDDQKQNMLQIAHWIDSHAEYVDPLTDFG
jgi:CRISPR-associated endonuclease Cas1